MVDTPRTPRWDTRTTTAQLTNLQSDVTATPEIPEGCVGILFVQATAVVAAPDTDIWITTNGAVAGTGIRLSARGDNFYLPINPTETTGASPWPPIIDVWGNHLTTAGICNVLFFFE